ncbi:alpha/beta hydrolase [Tsukamurella sp. 8F]|uniref:alpha/beta hydrolase n=1 Tax=unclassified Tsukamurella TaxID=2633480 RepID=UPI0023B8B44F|nr:MULTISPECIES: alpha/beta hydrolase [unclassified Tsukamurella]MDF0531216.1 alpha/beta hydrolase [Tsukamurella sp. 8J]MDF0588485.1 alpha/beta hydrolase [Tsukamurella sp. 8F]
MTATERLGAGRHLDADAVPEGTVATPVELSTVDGAKVAGILRTVPGATAVAFLMHPRQDFSHHVLVPEFLRRGVAVWTQGSRTQGNDLTLLHEQTLLDMAAGHVFLRENGFETVIAVGHSGGGALAAFYIEQAGLPAEERFAGTPGGKPVPLRRAAMPLPDHAVFMAPHPGQGELLMRMIDPSVADESDPLSVLPELDPFHADNGFRPAPEPSSYAPEFVERYRAAQRARVERIDAVARERVARSRAAQKRFKDGGDPADRRAALATEFVTVQRTDADLRCMDPSIDANDRPYGSLFGSRPDLTDYGVVGFGRLTTPEAWLSTWSGLSSRARFLRCAPAVTMPVLLIEITGDQACFPADALAMVAAFGSDDVEHVRVRGKHFGAALTDGEPTAATLAGLEIERWLAARVATAATR